jgi:hypothetical protein
MYSVSIFCLYLKRKHSEVKTEDDIGSEISIVRDYVFHANLAFTTQRLIRQTNEENKIISTQGES